MARMVFTWLEDCLRELISEANVRFRGETSVITWVKRNCSLSEHSVNRAHTGERYCATDNRDDELRLDPRVHVWKHFYSREQARQAAVKVCQ